MFTAATFFLSLGLFACAPDASASSALCLPDRAVDAPEALDLDAESGREVDAGHEVKAAAAAEACAAALQARYVGAEVRCWPAFPLGWSATVPLLAEVHAADATTQALFVKYCDDDAGVLDEVAAEAAWQKALDGAGHQVAPRVIYFDRGERMFVTERAAGAPATKALFRAASYRDQVARALAAVHGLPWSSVPAEPRHFVRRAAHSLRRIDDDAKLGAAQRKQLTAYAAALEKAIDARFVREVDGAPAHGDAKVGNMFFDAASDKVTLFDFGMAHAGDPAEDIGFFFASAHLPMADVDNFVAAYAQARGTAGSVRFTERVKLFVAYSRLDYYANSQRWYAHDPRGRSALASLVQRDYAEVAAWLPDFVPGLARF